MRRSISSIFEPTLIPKATLAVGDGIYTSPARALLPQLCAVAAILCGLAGLSGWAIDDSWLRGFGRHSNPVHPLSAITYIAIALSLLAAMHARRRLSTALLAVPLIYVAGWTFQTVSGLHIPVSTPVRFQASVAA